MHLKGTIADPQQNRRTFGKMPLTLIHAAQLPDRRNGGAVPIGLQSAGPRSSAALIDVESEMAAPSVMFASRLVRITDTDRVRASRCQIMITVCGDNHTMCKARVGEVIRVSWGAGYEVEL
jgi:hypothetical protein